MELSDREKQVMEWASRAFKKPWFDLCDRLQALYQGEPVACRERQFDPFFVPIKIDALIIYYLMKMGLVRFLLGNNASMFTLILNMKGDKIIWAAIELAKKGIYVEYFELQDRLDQAWADKALTFIQNQDSAALFTCLSQYLKADPLLNHIDLGIVKIANLRFFEALMEAWEEAGQGRNIPAFTCFAMNAVQQIVENSWLKIYPQVNLPKLLQSLAPFLKILHPIHQQFGSLFSALPI